MPVTWTDVRMVGDQFSEDRLGRGKAKFTYYAEADGFAFCSQALSANDGTTAIPVLGEAYSADRPGCLVVARNVERAGGKSPNQFFITIELEDPTDGSVTVGGLTAMPATIVVNYEDVMEEYTVDADGVKVLTKANEPFDRAPQRLSPIKNYNFEKYVDATTKAAIEAAYRTNNASAVTIQGISHPTDTLVLVSPNFLPVQAGVWRASFVVKYNPAKWVDRVPNVGYRCFETAAGTKHMDCQMYDVTAGKLVSASRPMPLNLNGTQMLPPPSDPSTWITLNFYPYSQAAWTGVPLS